jgi:hypothetical protein
MQKIYKIFNPATGEYEPAATAEECKQKLAQRAWEFYFSYAHSTPYSIVEVHNDGSEVWRNPQGEEVLALEQVQTAIQNLIPTQQ